MKYFIRSSVFGGEVLTDVNSTGKKLKTCVRANGTILAWQALDHSTSTPTETVRFEHSDASGMTRLMTTKTGEGAPFSEESDADAPMQLDPMGGNVGLQNAYPDDTLLPETESCLLCDSSGIPLMTNDDTPRARDGSRMKFSFQGISVSWAIASSILENSGGRMRKIENNARTTFLGYAVRTQRGREMRFDNWEDARTAAVRTETYQAYAIYSWAVNIGIFLTEEQQTRTVKYKKAVVPVTDDPYKKDLKDRFDERLKSQKCSNAMKALLKALGSKFSDMQALYKDVDDNGGFLQSLQPFSAIKDFLSPGAFAFAGFDKGKRVVVANAEFRNFGDLNYLSNKINYLDSLYGAQTSTLFHELLHLARDGEKLTTQILLERCMMYQ